MKIKTIIAFLAIVFFNLSTIGVTNAAKVDKLKFAFCDYIGETKKGKAHYMGSLTCEDGTNYVGEFRRNIINGDGILVILPPVIDEWIKENPLPQISDKEKIKKLFREVTEKFIAFEDLDDVLTEEGQERLKEKQRQAKQFFFTLGGYEEWYKRMIEWNKREGVSEDEVLDQMQMFAGKWKNGKFIEYFDPKKKFRRVVKLNKLKDIGGEREGNQDGDGNQAIINAANAGNIGDQGNIGDAIDGGGVIPGDGEKGKIKDKGVEVDVGGTKKTKTIEYGNTGMIYEGEVDENDLPNGQGKFTNTKTGDTYTGGVKDGSPSGKGKVAFGDDDGVIDGTWDKDGGKGTYTNEKTGDKYTGNFAFENDGEGGVEINPVGDGEGSQTDPKTGITREGIFKDGDLVDGKITDKKGNTVIEGTFGPGEKPLNATGKTGDGDILGFVDGKLVEWNGVQVAFEDGKLVELDNKPVGPRNRRSTKALLDDATLEMQGKGNKYYEAKTDIDAPAENIDPVDLAAAASSASNKDASGSNTGSNATGGFSMTEAGQQAEKDGGSGSGEKGSDGGGEGEGDGGGSM